MSSTNRINEMTLHAYVDGELDAAERREVEQWLLEHPEHKQQARAWTEQRKLLQDTYDPVLEEPVPAELASTLQNGQRRPFTKYAMSGAAALLLFVAGGATGWLVANSTEIPPDQGQSLVRQALGAHAVYVSEIRHPVEVRSDEKAHLIGWLSKRLGAQLIVPDLSKKGFQLVGGRLLPKGGEPAAQFMYEDSSGLRITVYVASNPSNNTTAFRLQDHGAVNSFYWMEGPLGYAVSGELDQNRLLSIARQVHGQLS